MSRSPEFVAVVALRPATVPDVPVRPLTDVAPCASAASFRSVPSEGSAPINI